MVKNLFIKAPDFFYEIFTSKFFPSFFLQCSAGEPVHRNTGKHWIAPKYRKTLNCYLKTRVTRLEVVKQTKVNR